MLSAGHERLLGRGWGKRNLSCWLRDVRCFDGSSRVRPPSRSWPGPSPPSRAHHWRGFSSAIYLRWLGAAEASLWRFPAIGSSVLTPRLLLEICAVHESARGPSRHFVAAQQTVAFGGIATVPSPLCRHAGDPWVKSCRAIVRIAQLLNPKSSRRCCRPVRQLRATSRHRQLIRSFRRPGRKPVAV